MNTVRGRGASLPTQDVRSQAFANQCERLYVDGSHDAFDPSFRYYMCMSQPDQPRKSGSAKCIAWMVSVNKNIQSGYF